MTPEARQTGERRDHLIVLALGVVASWTYALVWVSRYPTAQALTFIFAGLWTAVALAALVHPQLARFVQILPLSLAAAYFAGILAIALYVESIPSWSYDFLMTTPLLFTGLFRLAGRVRGQRLSAAFVALSCLILLPAVLGQSQIVLSDLAQQVAGRFLLGSVLFLATLGGTERVLEVQTQARTEAEVLARKALEDAMTGLGNRRALDEETDALFAQGTDISLALIFIDVDKFKSINDTLGHAKGDTVLQEVARRLKNAVRDKDTVYRISGDEFVVLARGAEESMAGMVAQRIVGSFRAPVDLDGVQLPVSVSVGVAVAPVNGTTVSDLLRYADHAMYEVKRDGRNGWKM